MKHNIETAFLNRTILKLQLNSFLFSQSLATSVSNIPLPTPKPLTIPETVTIQMPKTVTLTDSKPMVVSTEPAAAADTTPGSSEFSAYINEIIKLKLDDQSCAKEAAKAGKLEKQDSGSSTNKEEGNSEPEQASTPTLPPLKVVESSEESTVAPKKPPTDVAAPQQQLQQTATVVKSGNFESLSVGNSGIGSGTMMMAPAATTAGMAGLNMSAMAGSKMSFINLANSGQMLGAKGSSAQSISSNLSNFLVVRFELLANQENNSKSKSKYKKSIKIISVSGESVFW